MSEHISRRRPRSWARPCTGRAASIDALHWSRVAADCAATDDAGAQFLWRSLRAKTLARRGDLDEAQALGLEAAERAAKTDALSQRALVLIDRAEILALSEEASDADAVTAEAARLLEAKGNAAALARLRRRRTCSSQERRKAPRRGLPCSELASTA